MPKKTRARILRARITHLSLVDRGANQVGTLYKAEDDGSFEIQTLLAKSHEEGLLTALVYLPEVPDFHGHVASSEVIKNFAHDFFKEGGGNIDVMHELEDLEGGAHVAESFIVQKGDPRFEGMRDYDGNPVDPEGSWGVVIKLEAEALREKFRSGEFNGVSMFGMGLLKPTSETVTKFQNALADRLGNTPEGVQEMNEEQMSALLEKYFKPINERLEKLETPEPKPTEPVAEKVEFEGDASNPEDLAKHEDKLVKAECDLSTTEGLKKWREYLAAKTPAKPAEESKESPEIESLQKKIEELRGASGQSEGDVETAGTFEEKLQKGANLGKSIAEAHNKRYGRA